ncbi:uncharacterized protein FOMMEDRAFT_116527 [Fomitiporia mediterranea MF3/22]|uniref:uncharacterized protein n=1 Tax=Fomitiporia mediterranea (strain MF3/22) TaxID=694068 RepID=UPI00044094AA|nr:uncharacterized protein FOMMEDRAFT_116527 [Fomitiporia mediterranea MF3/22]EJD08084.1 hypothetical protein FOMMEDRAFT_116527 [Fomitiporia mediterranea MF3/22]
MLSDSESEGENLQQLTINEHFAKAYARKKEREELAKLKEKYGSDAEEGDEESEDSEDTDEDEDGEELTPAVDAAILRTLARIKRRDPGIYDAQKDVFEEEQQRTKGSFSFQAKDKDRRKPLLLRQHILNSNLKTTSRSPSPVPDGPTHAEEQATLRKETITVFHTAVPDDVASEDEDDILIPREKTKDEIEQEQEEYRSFLAREVGEDIGGLVTVESTGPALEDGEEEKERDSKQEENSEKKKKKKRKGKDKKSKEEADHEFLMNYILNRGWIDKSARHVPTFDEVTGSKVKKRSKTSNDEDAEEVGHVDIVGGEGRNDSDGEEEEFDEEEFDDVADTFESSYNFRFEEPDAATIPTHPREISSTVRREENPRKAQRERRKERKEEKLVQKREEVKRLKALKMKEIREKLERIGREGGKDADDEALAQLDLEGDWDPEAHDKQMTGIYGEDDGDDGGEVDLEKPTWDDNIDITDIVPAQPEAGPSSLSSTSKNKNKKKDKNKKSKAQDGDYAEDGGVDIDEMDADFINTNLTSNSKVNPKELDEAMDDVYGLEFNDMVGDIPTRFKYTPVLPQTYGLSPIEILLADDAELNNLVGLKKLAPYRRDRGRTWDPRRGEKLKEFRKGLSQKRGSAFESGTVTGANGIGVALEEEGRSTKKRKGKKEREKARFAGAVMMEDGPTASNVDGPDAGNEGNDGGGQEEVGEPPAKKRKRRHKSSAKNVES